MKGRKGNDLKQSFFFIKMAIQGLFLSFLTINSKFRTRFELQTSGIGSDRSTN